MAALTNQKLSKPSASCATASVEWSCHRGFKGVFSQSNWEVEWSHCLWTRMRQAEKERGIKEVEWKMQTPHQLAPSWQRSGVLSNLEKYSQMLKMSLVNIVLGGWRPSVFVSLHSMKQGVRVLTLVVSLYEEIESSFWEHYIEVHLYMLFKPFTHSSMVPRQVTIWTGFFLVQSFDVQWAALCWCRTLSFDTAAGQS